MQKQRRGEPFEPQNQQVLVQLLRKVREQYPEKNIWCYTGYLYDKELLSESRARCEYTDEMLSMIDVLVDGRFVEALKDIRLLHGQPQGMYGGDEAIHGSCPTQGSELCSAVELMFSLENMAFII